MTKLDLLDINERGDKNFDGLSEVEKNLYVLLLFFTLHEMEGITHFFSHHLTHLQRVLSFLAAIDAPNWHSVRDLADFLKTRSGGTWDPEALEEYLCNMSNEESDKIKASDHAYYSRTQEMWARAKEFVRQRHGVEFD